MLQKHFVLFCFIMWSFQIGTKTVLGSENEPNVRISWDKTIQINGVHQIQLKIDTKFKEEIIQLREFMKAEFALIQQKLVTQDESLSALQEQLTQQQGNLADLKEIVKTQDQKLTHIAQNLSQQRSLTESFMENELQAQNEKYQEHIKNQLNSICGQGFLEQIQNLSEHKTTNNLNQEDVLIKLIENAVNAAKTPPANPNSWDTNFNCTSKCGPIMELPNSCEQATPSNFSRGGVHLLKIENSVLDPFYAYCKRIDNKIWTVIQRREDGSVSFYRNWTDYKYGFGNLYGELWIGLERLHVMTTQHKHELHIWMKSVTGAEAYAHYNQFSVGSEAEKYKLTVGGYSGNASDELSAGGDQYIHNEMKFSTYDDCNDNHSKGNACCAISYKGGWWFNKCYLSHLNGPYFSDSKEGVDWNDFARKLKYAQMAIRRV